MGSIKKIVAPAYQRIAVDIANSIADGKYTVGQRISGRTTLASHYGVSPEAIRKAVCILQDVGVLSVTQGSGIEILSMEIPLNLSSNTRRYRRSGISGEAFTSGQKTRKLSRRNCWIMSSNC